MATKFSLQDTGNAANPEAADRWQRVPPNGRTCPITTFGHAKLYSLLGPDGLARKAGVRVVNVREPGAKRGILLFNVPDMLAWLNSLAQEQAGEAA